MGLQIERGSHGNGIQIVRTVVDTLQACNFSCGYCSYRSPTATGNKDILPAKTVKDIMQAANDQSQLDLVLSGGEITLHPEWDDIINATHVLDKTGTTLITNGSLLNEKRVDQLRDSNISRVGISLDGASPELHGYGRGNTFERALNGLYELKRSGKNITVISVVHQGNVERILELSDFLANNNLADQHHLCATYYSGRAKDQYKRFILPNEKVTLLQDKIDEVFEEFERRGLYITFNSYWPLTGLRPKSGNPREILSHQLGEQNKTTWAVVRSNGDVNATTAYWGRESVDNPLIGNLADEPAKVLFERLDDLYRNQRLFQLLRNVEAKYKFIVEGVLDKEVADALIGDEKKKEGVELIPCSSMADMDIMQKPIEQKYIDQIADLYAASPTNYRIVQHATGVFLFYDNTTAHVVLLNEDELNKLQARINSSATKA